MSRRRRIRHYGSRIRRRFHRKDRTIPILPVVTALMPVFQAYQHAGSVEGIFQDPMGFGKQLLYEYTGYDANARTFNAGQLVSTLSLMAVGYGGHWAANRFGINRAIHKIPFVGKHISL